MKTQTWTGTGGKATRLWIHKYRSDRTNRFNYLMTEVQPSSTDLRNWTEVFVTKKAENVTYPITSTLEPIHILNKGQVS